MRWLRKAFKDSRLRKYTLLILVLISLIFVTINVSKDTISINENFSEPYYIDGNITFEILKDDVTSCITKFIKDDAEKEMLVYDENPLSAGTMDDTFESSIFTALTSFNNLLSFLGTKAAIIEPSVLYCMLPSKYGELLLKRGFNLSQFSKSDTILTYGVMDYDVATLQKEKNINKFYGIGFEPYFIQHRSLHWMQAENSPLKFKTFPSHIFYKHKWFTIHMVVFHQRNNYYWHAALGTEDNPNIPQKETLLFVDHDGAYEKFPFLSLENKILPVAEFYVPLNPHYFLFEMKTSRFLECDFSRAANVLSSKFPKSHPAMSVGSFNRRTHIALRELKMIFHPLLMNFWILSGTLLGWYRQCDIIPYTTDIDFGAWASEVEDLDAIINPLLQSKEVKIKERMGLLKEALEFHLDCHNLRADVFFLYRIRNGTWYAGHSPRLGYYFRYYLPNFTLCSAELLGEKVQVPCEAEKVIEADYGPGWSKPAAKWDYETSSKNRSPNIFWGKDVKKNAYQVFTNTNKQ